MEDRIFERPTPIAAVFGIPAIVRCRGACDKGLSSLSLARRLTQTQLQHFAWNEAWGIFPYANGSLCPRCRGFEIARPRIAEVSLTSKSSRKI
jgi:hypothetical protein